MNKIIILVFLSLLLLSTKVDAKESLALTFYVNKNGTISTESVQYAIADELLPRESGDYKIKIFDTDGNSLFSTNFDVQFVILSEPPIETDSSLIYMRVPWYNNSATADIYHNDQLIGEISLFSYICNKNAQCESSRGENQVNCPEDCFEGTMTTTSTMPEVTTTLPLVKPSTPIYVYLIAIGIIVALVIFLISKIKIVK